MKRLLIAVYSLCLATSLLSVRADDAAATETPKNSTTTTPKKPAPALTEEQKALRKEMLAKYDANKDGKIDKEERKKVTDEDKAKLKKAGLTPKQQKKATKKA